MKNNIIMLCMCLMCFSNYSCKKEDDFLNAKPNQALFVPATLQDLEQILNNQNIFNIGDPALGELASDDFYLTNEAIDNEDIVARNGYLWAKEIYNTGQNVNDWSVPYQQVYYANTVLNSLQKFTISPSQAKKAEQIRGTALFFRALAFYNLVQTFAMPYDAKTAATDAGIPLRLDPDLNKKSVRASVQDCFEQVLKDLQEALPLLPSQPSLITQPSQPAANAAIARVTLAMGDYDKAFQFADACLKQFNTITDYNTLNPSPYSIHSGLLSEDIFHSVQQSYGPTFINYEGITDPVLYSSYDDNDLRKSVCFVINDGKTYFSGTYDIQYANYTGIATDEVILIRAECSARLGNSSASMKDLNDLLVKRWKTGTYTLLTAGSPGIALDLVLKERRKELLFRGLRWTDLRRLNKDPRYAVTLQRTYNGKTYTLPPNDPRYAMPIPDNEITNSSITQNPR